MEEPQGQNRFFERCAQMLLELSDELERNLYIEAIVKEYRSSGISVENLKKRVESSCNEGNSGRAADSAETCGSRSRKEEGECSRESTEADAYLAGDLSGHF